jgi:dTDP-4-dehydrorhamnose 3,5-epimerase-like enzyme
MAEQVVMMNGGIAVDDRGSVRFVNDFNFKDVKRFYQVENHRQGFIRAWHGHFKEGKYVYVASGSAWVAAMPLYRDHDGLSQVSTLEGKKFVMSAKKPQVLYIPPGWANGFKNLEENTNILFFSTTTLEEGKDDDIRFKYDTWTAFEEEYR